MVKSSDKSPIPFGAPLGDQTDDALNRQVQFELDRLLSTMTQEELAHIMDYQSGSQLSKILRAQASLPVSRASFLDSAFGPTSQGATWHSLLEAQQASLLKRRQHNSRPNVDGQYDIFLASPMASTVDQTQYAEAREQTVNLASALRVRCGYKVYCATEAIHDKKEFDSAAFALNDNVPALENSARFVLLVDGVISKPSSVWVEAGFAMARAKSATYFVPSLEVLPYVLQQAADSRNRTSAKVSVVLTSKEQSAADCVAKHGRALFEQ